MELVEKHGAEFRVTGQCTVFVCSNGEFFLALLAEDVDEKTYDVERCSFAGGGKDPRVGGTCVDNGESCVVVTNGSD